ICRKSFCIKRGRRDSNPQPPDRQNGTRGTGNPFHFEDLRQQVQVSQGVISKTSLSSLPYFALPYGLIKAHSCEFTNAQEVVGTRCPPEGNSQLPAHGTFITTDGGSPHLPAVLPDSWPRCQLWYPRSAARGHVQGAIKGWASSPRDRPRSSRRAQSSTARSGEVPATARGDHRRVGSGMALPAPRSVGCGGAGLRVGYVPWR